MKCRMSVLFVVILSLAMTQALPAAEPVNKVSEKKITIPEEPLLKKVDITESSPAIAVEEAEEPKQADRAKKSASTTFCVEIRPGPSEAPVKVCENQPLPPAPIPQVPQEAHEVHEHPPPPPPPPPPTYIQEPQNPIFIIQPNSPEILIPNEPCPPQIPPQQAFLHFPQIFQHQPPPPPPPQSSQQVLIPSVVTNPYPTPPQQTIVIPGAIPNPYPTPPQQTIVIPGAIPNPYPQSPCPPTPCAAASASGIHPHAMLTLFRSAMAPMNGALSSLNGMEMRSSNDAANMDFGKEASSMDFVKEASSMEFGKKASSVDSGDAMSSRMDPNQDVEMVETVGTPIVRTHTKKLYGPQPSLYSPYASNVYNQRSPYVIRCNPQLLSLGNGGSAYAFVSGRGRSSELNLMDTNGQPMMASDGPLSMGMTQQARTHVIQPVVQPYITTGGGYSSHSVIPSVVQHTTYQSYPSPIDPYPVHQHSVLPGFSVHHQQPNVILPPSISINSHPGIIGPTNSGGIYRMGSDQQRYRLSQQRQLENSEKSWKSEAEERAAMDQQTSRSQQYGAISPSQMLERMRGNSASSSFVKRPMMQSFPRVSGEDRSSSDCHTAKIAIPRSGQPFMISGSRNSMDEKNADRDDDVVAMHDDMGKREAEKSATDKEE